MNTRLPFLTLLACFLTLVAVAPACAMAQAREETNPSTAAVRGRQNLSNKLERIRLETVSYDGLPLGEIVNHLLDEAKKRDPEKKGINFMINPNLPPGTAVAAPMDPATGLPVEPVDVGSILVRIRPALTDVRLLDALDAVVAVAERPIQYTVEDYGVVFSPRGSEPVRKAGVSFAFPGGTPSQFLEAVQAQYKVDWLSVAEIPREMADARIPKLRIQQDAFAAGPGTGGGGDALGGLVSLYNQLGEQKPELGRLIVKGDLTKPSVVMFVPDKAAAEAQPKLKVKALSIWGISDAERGKLQEDIERAKVEATDYASRLRGAPWLRGLEGTVAIHSDTSLLVAAGAESFVDMVESIVNACLAKQRARNPSAPSVLPYPPGR